MHWESLHEKGKYYLHNYQKCYNFQMKIEYDRMLSRLINENILITRGQKKGTEFMINPKLITNSKINIKPTLKLIEPYRLKALILEVKDYPNSLISEIHKR